MSRAAWGLLALATTVFASSPTTTPTSQEEVQEGDPGLGRPPWVAAILTRVLSDYVPSGNYPLDPCTQDGRAYADNLANLTFWATKMYDASSQGISSGILEGRNVDFGHFDECAEVSSPYHGIRGKYVVAQLRFQPSPDVYPNFYNPPRVYTKPREEGSAWEAIKPTLDRRVPPGNAVSWAVCVPASCSDYEIETSLGRKIFPALESHKIHGNLTVLSEYSYSRSGEKLKLTKLHYTFICVTTMLVGLVLYSTLYDLNVPFSDQEKKPWFFNFSMKKNMNSLFKVPHNEFAVMSGLKVISMFLIIYGHRMMISVSTPQYNPRNVQLASGTFWATFVDNGTLVVNTFMTITGFLTFYKITKDMYNNRELSVCKNICNRFLRLTPAYLFVLLVQYLVFPLLEGGPMSRAVVWDPNTFGTYWWTHLSYINNYVKPAFQCLIPSWYLALDMQMYIFAYVLGAILQKMRSLTPYVLSLWTILSLAAPAVTVATTKYWGTYLIHYTTVMGYFRDPEFQDLYMPTHIRASPYIIGMLGGYIYYQLKSKKITFENNTMWTWALFSSAIFQISLGGAYPFYLPDREYVLWENVAYTVLHRIGWAATIVWIVIASSTSNFGLYQYTLGLRVFEPLNKLTYNALLIHTLVQIYMVGFIRAPTNYGRIMGIWMACGDIVFTYIFSAILYCLVEAPFSNLQKKLWKTKTVDTKK